MKKIIILLIGFVFLLTACLSTDVVEVEIPHNEYLVVQGILEKDSVFSGVRFTKTLSLSETYDVNNAKLEGVVSYLLIDGIKTIPLHHTKEGIYKPLYPHKIHNGSTYELFAEYDGTKMYAKTVVPDTVFIVKSELDKEGYIRNRVRYDSRFVYGATWDYGYVHSDDFHSIVPDIEISDDVINVRTQPLPEEFQNRYAHSRVYVFDKFYRKYFETKGNNNDSLFSNVTVPNWNTQSNKTNVIGLFIGTCKSRIITVNP